MQSGKLVRDDFPLSDEGSESDIGDVNRDESSREDWSEADADNFTTTDDPHGLPVPSDSQFTPQDGLSNDDPIHP
jgi:hypothetical protein